MAERLAPEQVQVSVSSRPESPRRRMRRWLGALAALVVAAVLLASGALFVGHFLSIQGSASVVRATSLVPLDQPARVLVVVARPSQELPMAGTLAELDDAGAEVAMLSLTRGEAQLPELRDAGDRLGEIRADELARAAEVVGVDSVTTADFADGSLLGADPDAVTAAISGAIEAWTPSTILTVSDQTGSDGDSQAVSAYTLAAAQAEDSGVARVWTVTRGDREVSWNARIGHPIASVLPSAEVAVRIDDQASAKGEVLRSHGTQSPDLADHTYPLASTVPAWAYFRFWDREYFALTWGPPID